MFNENTAKRDINLRKAMAYDICFLSDQIKQYAGNDVGGHIEKYKRMVVGAKYLPQIEKNFNC